MAFAVTAKIEGLELLLFNLQQLRSSKARSVNRRALQSAASLPLKAAKRRVPKDTGQLRKSLGKKSKTYRDTGTSVVIIGPRVGYKDPATGRNPVKYAHLVELGTVRLQARPYLRPALQETHSQVINVYQQRAWEGIRREVSRMKK